MISGLIQEDESQGNLVAVEDRDPLISDIWRLDKEKELLPVACDRLLTPLCGEGCAARL